MGKQHQKPCRECPFKLVAKKGFTGHISPERFVRDILDDKPLPCHMTIDYTNPNWQRQFLDGSRGRHCAGAIICASNQGIKSKHPDRPVLAPDTENVFPSFATFVTHHRDSDTPYWVRDYNCWDEIETTRAEIGLPSLGNGPDRGQVMEAWLARAMAGLPE